MVLTIIYRVIFEIKAQSVSWMHVIKHYCCMWLIVCRQCEEDERVVKVVIRARVGVVISHISLGQADTDKGSGDPTDFFRTSDSVCKVVIAKASVVWIGYWSSRGNNVEQVVTAELSLILLKASVRIASLEFTQSFEHLNSSKSQHVGRCWTDAYWVKLKESPHINLKNQY